jgi:FAD/FMN-containing dehydrogenase
MGSFELEESSMRARSPAPLLDLSRVATAACLLLLLAAPAGAQSRPSGICPGLLLAYSCGNKTCEPGLSENSGNCPQDCLVAPLKSYNNLKACTDVDVVRTASSTAQIQQYIGEAAAAGQKVKISGNRHSISDVICTSGVVIKSSQATIHGIETFEGQEVVRVDAGVKTGDLAEWLHARGKSLGYALMGFRLPTVGGAVATGSHGSSPRFDSVLASRVRSVQLVDSAGALRNFTKGTTPETNWRALTANAGMLGMVTQLRLAIEPQFKLRVRVTYNDESSLFATGGALAQMSACDYGTINWFPRTKKWVKTCGTVSTSAPASGAENVMLNPAPGFDGALGIVRNAWQSAACDRGFAVTVEGTQYSTMLLSPPFQKDGLCCGAKVRSTDLVGYSHRMISSGFASSGDQIANVDWEVVVPQQYAEQALRDVRDILARHNASVWEIGIFLRFTKVATSSWLANAAEGGSFRAGDTAMYIEMPVIEPIDFNSAWMAWYEAPYKEVVEKLVRDYDGRIHLGKNKKWLFQLERTEGTYGTNVTRFNQALQSLGITSRFDNGFAADIGVVFP